MMGTISAREATKKAKKNRPEVLTSSGFMV
jgi:hypothetical protein